MNSNSSEYETGSGGEEVQGKDEGYLQSFHCMHCKHPYEDVKQKRQHEHYCQKRKLRDRLVESSISSRTYLRNPLERQQTESSEKPETKLKKLGKYRKSRHDEAIGYDNTMLLSIDSLSDVAKSAIREKRNFLHKASVSNGAQQVTIQDSDNEITDEAANDLLLEIIDGASQESEEEGPQTLDEINLGEENKLFSMFDNSDDDADESDGEFECGEYFEDLRISNTYDFRQSTMDQSPPCQSEQHPTPTRPEDGLVQQDSPDDDDDNDSWAAFKVNEDISNAKELHIGEEDKIDPKSMKMIDIAFIDLLWRLGHHRTDLNIFDDIVEWVVYFSRSSPKIFTSFASSTPRTRRGFVNRLKKIFKRDRLKTEIANVTVPSGRIVTLPYYPFEQQAFDMLTNEDLVQPENMCAQNFDPDTWKQIVPVEDFLDTTASLDEVIREEVATEASMLVAPSIPNSPDQLLGKRIEVLWFFDKDGIKQWSPGTVTEVTRFGQDGAEVRVEWEKTKLHKRSTTGLQTLLFERWWKDEEQGWRYQELEENITNVHVNEDIESHPNTSMQRSVAVDDLYTGTMMTKGISRFVGDLVPPGVHYVRPLATVWFIDKSHTDLFGSLATTPISFTFAAFNIESRRQSKFWRNIAFLPPLNVGKGTNAGKLDIDAYIHDETRRRKGHKRPKDSVSKLRDFQALLHVAMDSFKKACQTGFIIVHRDGTKVLYKPFLLLTIGDTAGNNELTCHYNSSGNSEIKCLNYSCKCSFMDLIKTPSHCVPITKRDIEHCMVDDSIAASLSQHQVPIEMNKLALADSRHGISAHMPKENLHVFGAGLYASAIQVIHDLIGRRGKNAKYKDHLDQLHQRVTFDIRRNSERNIPRSSNRYGFMDRTRITATERKGNLYVFLVALHTFQGIGIMKPFLERANISIGEFANTITMLLSYDLWTVGRNIDRIEVINAKDAAEELMRNIMKNLPKKVVKKGSSVKNLENLPKKKSSVAEMPFAHNPEYDEQCTLKPIGIEVSGTQKRQKLSRAAKSKTPHSKESKPRESVYQKAMKKNTKIKSKSPEIVVEGSNGWHTVKFHALPGYPLNMERFGSASNFDAGHGENHHIDFVKKPGANTNRRVPDFTKQVGFRNEENNLVNYAHHFVEDYCPKRKLSNRLESHLSQPGLKLCGKYIIDASIEASHQSRSSFKTIWMDKRKNALQDQFRLHDLLYTAIDHHALSCNFYKNLALEGYTELSVVSEDGIEATTYRASPNFRGMEWHDWALIQFPHEELSNPESNQQYYRIANILGFVRYRTPGYPTFQLNKIERKSIREIRDGGMKDDGVYVVAECSSHWVCLDDLDMNMVTPFMIEREPELRILPVSSLIRPLAVVTNYRAPDKTHYLACLPEHKWANIFRSRIMDLYKAKRERAQVPTYKSDPQLWKEYHTFNDEIEEDSDSDEDSIDDEDSKGFGDDDEDDRDVC